MSMQVRASGTIGTRVKYSANLSPLLLYQIVYRPYSQTCAELSTHRGHPSDGRRIADLRAVLRECVDLQLQVRFDVDHNVRVCTAPEGGEHPHLRQ